jgi:hypothetical protein
MTAKNKPTFNALENIQENKNNLMKMMQAEDYEIEKQLCKPEGFILSGLPEKLDMLIELEKEFMKFDFEDLRKRTENDSILNELEAYFGRKLKKKKENCKRSIFDLVIIIRSRFDQLIKSKLNKFEIVEQGKEIDLNFMTESDKKHVSEFVNKVRIDDNVYSLPSKFHSNLKESENICELYRDNFKSNADLSNQETELILDINDEDDIAFSIKQVEDVLDNVMKKKEKLFQDLLISTEKQEEINSNQVSRKKKKENLLTLNTSVNSDALKEITLDFLKIIKNEKGVNSSLKCKES